ncbi:high affinity immunoglobulin epsilon receptor subunit gamma isoform X2 [Cynoglossus semilaevis]|uniref:high affinity immunoglobulin epsilon receptor subunit gamma isoform X2 n=1 Tax=Cynoglossus semilaevis TaxID=244447 RepID=UPI00049561BA|nr:high affinity immunoglobulin epsilon receptor subunit gamma isoform X2 [Cynoglossus semilaevis]
MAFLRTRTSLVAILLLMCFDQVSGLTDPQVCYVLDGILFVYGVVLTALYCKVTIFSKEKDNDGTSKKNGEDSIYTDLTPRVQDTYEVIGMKKSRDVK